MLASLRSRSRWARRAALCLAALCLLGASDAPSPVEVLIDAAPEGYVLSPESQGITGPLTPEKFSELGGADLEAELDDSTEGYLRFWSDQRGGAIVAVAMRSREGDAGAAILRGALDRVSQGTTAPFDVPEVEGAHGFTTQVDQAAGVVVVQSVIFRRGPLVFLLSASAPPPGPPAELVGGLAQAQQARAPEGPSSADSGVEGLTTALGVVAGVVVVGLSFVVIALLVRGRRGTPTRHPTDEPSVRPPAQAV